ncbi:hypothetical protein KKG56_04265 [bacterium]|nr:hypothetical protein [bacterium]
MKKEFNVTVWQARRKEKKDRKPKPNKKNQPDKEQVIFAVSLTRERKNILGSKKTVGRKIVLGQAVTE